MHLLRSASQPGARTAQYLVAPSLLQVTALTAFSHFMLPVDSEFPSTPFLMIGMPFRYGHTARFPPTK